MPQIEFELNKQNIKTKKNREIITWFETTTKAVDVINAILINFNKLLNIIKV